MSVLTQRFSEMVDEEVVVVMSDDRAFRGTLREYDERCLVLEDVVEGTTENARGWEEPTAGTGVVHKVVTWQGVFSHEDNEADVVRLKDVVIHIDHVLRIWAWDGENLRPPEHVEVTEGTGTTVDAKGRRKGKPRGPRT